MRILKAACIAFISGVSFSAAQAQDVRVVYWSSGASAAIGLVLEEGKFLEAEGLQPKWTTVTKLAETNRALISRSVDFIVSGGAVPTLRLGAEGVPARVILANLIADANFVVPENSPIKSLADLKGKKIGSTPPGSTMHALVGTILQTNYGLAESDFQQIPSGESQLLTFMSRGEIDAALMRTITLRTIGAKEKLRVLSTVPEEWKKIVKSDAPPVLGVGVVDLEFATKNPEIVNKYLVANIKATRWGADNPDKVADILQRRLQMSADDAKALAGTWRNTYFASMGEADIDSLLRMADIFKAAGNFPGTVTRDLFLTEPFQKANAIAGAK